MAPKSILAGKCFLLFGLLVVADAAPTPEAETARSSRQIFILDPAASGNLNVFYPWAPIQVSWVDRNGADAVPIRQRPVSHPVSRPIAKPVHAKPVHAKPVHAKPVGKPAAKPVKPLGKPTSKPVKPSKPAHHHSHKHPDYESHIFGRNVMLYPDYPDFVLID